MAFLPWCSLPPTTMNGGSAPRKPRARAAVVVRGRVQRAQDGILILEGGDLRKQLTDANAGRPRRNRGEGAAKLRRGRRLGVPGVELRRPAPQPEKDHRPRRAVAVT